VAASEEFPWPSARTFVSGYREDLMAADNSLTPVGSLRVASADDITAGACDADVGNGWRANMFDTAVVISTGAEIIEQPFAGTQQDRYNHKMHLIDQRSTKVLPDGGAPPPTRTS
jgi:hypothetical protein